MKAADITDEQFMAALNPTGWSTWWDVAARLDYPEKVVLAKARTLIVKRGTLHGCFCGCRGDWHPAEGCVGC